MLGDRNGSHKRDSRQHTEHSRHHEPLPDAAQDGGIGYFPGADDFGRHAAPAPVPGAFGREPGTGAFGYGPPAPAPAGDRADDTAAGMFDVASVFDADPESAPMPRIPDPAEPGHGSAPETEPHYAVSPPAEPGYGAYGYGAGGLDGYAAEPAPAAARAESMGGRDDDHDLPQVRIVAPEAPEKAPSGGFLRGKAVKIGVAAATLAVLATGTVVTVNLVSADSEPEESRVLTAPAPAADPAVAAEQRKAAADQRRQAVRDEAARAGRNAFRDRPGLSVKSKPKPKPREDAEPGGASPIGPVLSGSPREIARKMLPKYGWSPSSQFGCLDRLWQKESNWNPRAANPSGAYGIPQALPGSKMSSAGPDWETNPATQIEWGLDYIKGRYSSPCGAWEHSENVGWY